MSNHLCFHREFYFFNKRAALSIVAGKIYVREEGNGVEHLSTVDTYGYMHFSLSFPFSILSFLPKFLSPRTPSFFF